MRKQVYFFVFSLSQIMTYVCATLLFWSCWLVSDKYDAGPFGALLLMYVVLRLFIAALTFILKRSGVHP